MTKDELKKKLDSLGDEEKDYLKEYFGTKKESQDIDLVNEILNVKQRLELLEKLKTPEKKKGFFDSFF